MNKMNNINEERSRDYRAVGPSTLLPLDCVPFGCAACDTAQRHCLRCCVESKIEHKGSFRDVDNVAHLSWGSRINAASQSSQP